MEHLLSQIILHVQVNEDEGQRLENNWGKLISLLRELVKKTCKKVHGENSHCFRPVSTPLLQRSNNGFSHPALIGSALDKVCLLLPNIN